MIDYRTDDVTAQTATYDVIVDCAGTASHGQVEHLLSPGGALLPVIADLRAVVSAPWRSRRTRRRITATPTAADLVCVVDLAEAGHYRAVRDRTYEPTDIAEAHRYADAGRKRGNVVVRIGNGGAATTRRRQSREHRCQRRHDTRTGRPRRHPNRRGTSHEHQHCPMAGV